MDTTKGNSYTDAVGNANRGQRKVEERTRARRTKKDPTPRDERRRAVGLSKYDKGMESQQSKDQENTTTSGRSRETPDNVYQFSGEYEIQSSKGRQTEKDPVSKMSGNRLLGPLHVMLLIKTRRRGGGKKVVATNRNSDERNNDGYASDVRSVRGGT